MSTVLVWHERINCKGTQGSNRSNHHWLELYPEFKRSPSPKCYKAVDTARMSWLRSSKSFHISRNRAVISDMISSDKDFWFSNTTEKLKGWLFSFMALHNFISIAGRSNVLPSIFFYRTFIQSHYVGHLLFHSALISSACLMSIKFSEYSFFSLLVYLILCWTELTIIYLQVEIFKFTSLSVEKKHA